jgi:hypothetical protein
MRAWRQHDCRRRGGRLNKQRNRRDIRLKGRVTQRSNSRNIGDRVNKCDIKANEVASKNRTIATISLLGCGIPQKDTFSSMRVKLIKIGTQIMNIANTPKNLQWQGERG